MGYIFFVFKILFGCELNVFGNCIKFLGFNNCFINVLKLALFLNVIYLLVKYRCILIIKSVGFKNLNI